MSDWGWDHDQDAKRRARLSTTPLERLEWLEAVLAELGSEQIDAVEQRRQAAAEAAWARRDPAGTR